MWKLGATIRRYFAHLVHPRAIRPHANDFRESLNGLFDARGRDLDAAVRKIPHPTGKPESPGVLANEPAKPYPLHPTHHAQVNSGHALPTLSDERKQHSRECGGLVRFGVGLTQDQLPAADPTRDRLQRVRRAPDRRERGG